MTSHIQILDWNKLDVDEQIEQIVDINDALFEQIDLYLAILCCMCINTSQIVHEKS